jgi:non-ribosomal peptide synthetase component F
MSAHTVGHLPEDGHRQPGTGRARFRQMLARPAAIHALAAETGTTPALVAWTAAALLLARLADGAVALGFRPALGAPLVTKTAPSCPDFRTALRHAATEKMQGDDTPDYSLHARPLASPEFDDGATLSLALLVDRPTGSPCPALWVEISADPAAISPPRARSLCHALARFLDAVAVDPNADPSHIALADRHHRAPTMPWQPPGPGCALPAPAVAAHASLAHLFGAILARWPNRLAIVTPSRQMSFAEIDLVAAALAATLYARGARAGDVVALRLTHAAPSGSAALYPCLTIAARRLGCAVMPLSQQIGAQQAQDQMARVGARFLLSASPDCGADWLTGATCDPIRTFSDAVLFSAPTRAPASPPEAAILLTTSGTTGQPRTVMLSDAMILGFLISLIGTGLVPAEPGLMCPNIGFDLAIADIWLPWSLGRHVVLLDTESRSPVVLAQARSLGARTRRARRRVR